MGKMWAREYGIKSISSFQVEISAFCGWKIVSFSHMICALSQYLTGDDSRFWMNFELFYFGHLSSEAFNLKRIKCLVLDEADRLLDDDTGFPEQLQLIFKYMPKKRQTLLFSGVYISVSGFCLL